MNLTCAVPEVNRAKRFAPLLLRMRSRRRSEKIDALTGVCDFENESRIVPSTKRLLCSHVDCTFTFWTGDGNCQIRFSVDFTALNTITTTEPTKRTNNSAMLKQPSGTNHFQFRFHQLRLGVGETAGCICSTATFVRRTRTPWQPISLAQSKLDGFICGEAGCRP